MLALRASKKKKQAEQSYSQAEHSEARDRETAVPEERRKLTVVPSLPKETTSEAKAPEPPTPEVSEPENVVNSPVYSIEVLTQFLNDQGAAMLAEILRRVSVKQFRQGLLEVEGPEFQVTSLEVQANKAKLIGLLKQYSDVENWTILTKTSTESGSATSDSLAGRDQVAKEQNITQQKEKILKHDSVKNVIKVFPGSKVEKIRLKRLG